MPLPFILGGLAVAAVATGAKKGIDGYSDKSKADDIIKEAKSIYETAKQQLDTTQEECQTSLDQLGKLYLNIGQDFYKFQTLAESLIKQVEKSGNKHLEINIPKLSLNKIESIALNSVAFVGKMAGGAAGGAAAAYAVYGGVMSLAAASTGTAISSLSGVAAYNATLAAIGGGSIASGGFGMAVGAQILGGVVAAPVALVAGFAYASYGAEALEKAKKSRTEAENFAIKSNASIAKLATTKSYIDLLKLQVSKLHAQFQTYLEDLKAVEIMVRRGKQADLAKQSEVVRMVQNGYAMAAILADVITIPLFKVKKDNNNIPVLGENNEPILLTDESGLNVLNANEMTDVIKKIPEKIRNLK